jgi:hypothetical protein
LVVVYGPKNGGASENIAKVRFVVVGLVYKNFMCNLFSLPDAWKFLMFDTGWLRNNIHW